jgi:hypothetical protein
MWGKAKIDDEETAKVASSRLITVLGLDHSEVRDRVSSPVRASGSEPINAGVRTPGSPIHAMEQRPSQREDGTDRGLETPSGQKSQGDMSFHQTSRVGAATCVQDAPRRADELHATVEDALTELSQKSETLVEKRARQFEESLSRIGTKTLSEVDATAPRTASRLENCVAETDGMELTMDESLANLARKMTEAAHGQISILEESLANIAEQVGSRIQREFEPLAKRVENYHAQAEEMNSNLESALARFTQRAEDAAKAQAWLLDEKITRISEQAVSQAQESVQSGITQFRDTAAQSFEERIAAFGESVEKRLKESFEAWSKAQLEIVQQQASKLSSDLLSQVRSESENIAHYLHARLKSDAQLLETKTFDGMQSKLQKVTEEFRSVLERTLA